jgi:hypothetical protein
LGLAQLPRPLTHTLDESLAYSAPSVSGVNVELVEMGIVAHGTRDCEPDRSIAAIDGHPQSIELLGLAQRRSGRENRRQGIDQAILGKQRICRPFDLRQMRQIF